MKFETEIQMSIKFTDFLHTKFSEKEFSIFSEFKGLIGIPDLVIVQMDDFTISNVISIELKLNNWNRALKQAFKYRNFSNESYVVINELNNIESIIENFIKANIGLATFNQNGELKVHHSPKHSIPFSDFFIKKLENKINEEFLPATGTDSSEYFFDFDQRTNQNVFINTIQF